MQTEFYFGEAYCVVTEHIGRWAQQKTGKKVWEMTVHCLRDYSLFTMGMEFIH